MSDWKGVGLYYKHFFEGRLLMLNNLRLRNPENSRFQKANCVS